MAGMNARPAIKGSRPRTCCRYIVDRKIVTLYATFAMGAGDDQDREPEDCGPPYAVLDDDEHSEQRERADECDDLVGADNQPQLGRR